MYTKGMYPSSKMEDEDVFLEQNDLCKIFIRLNSLEKSGFRKKKLVTPLRGLLTTLLNYHDVLEDVWTVKRAFSLLRLT